MPLSLSGGPGPPPKSGKTFKRSSRDLFKTFSRLSHGGFFSDFFRVSGPEGPRDYCKWSTRSQHSSRAVPEYCWLSRLVSGMAPNQGPSAFSNHSTNRTPRVLLALPIGFRNGSESRPTGCPNRSSNRTRRHPDHHKRPVILNFELPCKRIEETNRKSSPADGRVLDFRGPQKCTE